jgi:hypothetical protein
LEIEAYDTLEPIGEIQPSDRMALLTSTLVNVAKAFAAGSKKVQFTKMSDYILQYGPKEEEDLDSAPVQPVSTMRKILEALASSGLVKKVTRKKEGSK